MKWNVSNIEKIRSTLDVNLRLEESKSSPLRPKRSFPRARSSSVLTAAEQDKNFSYALSVRLKSC